MDLHVFSQSQVGQLQTHLIEALRSSLKACLIEARAVDEHEAEDEEQDEHEADAEDPVNYIR